MNEMYLNYFKLFGIDKYLMRFSTHDPRSSVRNLSMHRSFGNKRKR